MALGLGFGGTYCCALALSRSPARRDGASSELVSRQLSTRTWLGFRVRDRDRVRVRVRVRIRVRIRARVTSASFGRRPGVSPGRKEPSEESPSAETTEEVPLR